MNYMKMQTEEFVCLRSMTGYLYDHYAILNYAMNQ